MIYGNYTPPGFDEDRYFDESDRAPLTAEQIAAMNEVWPQYAKPQPEMEAAEEWPEIERMAA